MTISPAASIAPRPGILDIQPYVPGPDGSNGKKAVYKLSANESALGPSPTAVDAMRAAAGDAHLYPDGGANRLRQAIADVYGLDPERIVCGAGSDELLQLLARAYLGPEDVAVQTRHGFLVYSIAAKACGARVAFVDEKSLTADVDALLDAVDDDVRIVFLANPNNPTGTVISDAEVRRLREGMPPDVLLVLDAAYAEYIDDADYGDPAQLVEDFTNVVMTRTFSKIYGLGGLRLGWAYCPAHVADVLNRIRGPFNVSAAAIAAGVAAMVDQDFVHRNRTHNTTERRRLEQQLGRLGVESTPSAANFILVKMQTAEEVAKLVGFLAERSVMVRSVAAYGLPEYFRVSIGAREANDAFLAALDAYLNK
jgi:histidinol-phosphate aminotransferase